MPKMVALLMFVLMSKKWNVFDGKIKYSHPNGSISNSVLLFTVYRAHRNDMENILPGFLIGIMYVMIDPSPLVACLLFKVAAMARIAHTIVYAVIIIPQPARALAFFIHYLITLYMGLYVLFSLV